MKLSISAHRLPILAAALISLIGTAHSAPITKANNADALNLATSWLGGTLPGNTDTALWDSTVTASNTVSLGADLALQGISLIDPAGPVTLNTGNTLTLGTSGIDLSAATQDLSILSNLTLATGEQTWNIPSGRALTLGSGAFSRASGNILTINNTGSVTSAMSGLANTNGILGPWAFTGTGTDTRYATLNTGAILPYTTATALSGLTGVFGGMPSGGAGTVNYDVAGSGTFPVYGLARNINTLRYTGTGATQQSNTSADLLTINGILNAGTGALNIGGGSFALRIAIGTSNNLVLAAESAPITIANEIKNGASPGSVTIQGAETNAVTLAGPNTYTGGTFVSSGRLFAGSTAMNGGPIHISNNATLTFTGTNQISTSTLTGQGTILNDSANTIILTGNHTAFSGTFTHSAPANNTQFNSATAASPTAAYNISAGELIFAASGDYTVPFGSLTSTGGNIRGGNAATGTTTLEVGNLNTDSSIAGNLNNGATKVLALTKIGTGTLTLAGTNTYSGTTTISAGTLQIQGSIAASNSIVNDANLVFDPSSSFTYANPITGSGDLTLTGGGSLTLSGNNNFSGNTFFNEGQLRLNGSFGPINVTDDAFNLIAPATGTSFTSSSLTFDGEAEINLPSPVNPADPSRITVSGTLTTTPANGKVTIYIEPGIISNGSYNLITFGSLAGDLSDFELFAPGLNSRQSANLILNASTITLEVDGDSPKWTGLDSSSWTTGTTGPSFNWQLINGATPTNYQDEDDILFDDTAPGSTTINIDNGDVLPRLVTFNNSSKDYTLTSASFGVVSGTLIKSGSASLTIDSDNLFSGGLTLEAGTLNINSPSAIGSGPLSIAPGSSKTINNTSGSPIANFSNNTQSWLDNFTFTGSNDLDLGTGTVTIGGDETDRSITVTASTLTIGEIKAPAHGLIKSGNGTLILSSSGAGAESTVIAGKLDLSAGTLQINRTATTAVTSGDLTATGLSGTGSLTNGADVERRLFINSASDDTFSGTLANGGTGPLSFSKTGAGTLTLTNTSTYTGNTFIGAANGAGVLRVTASGALGSGTIVFDPSGGGPGPSSRLELDGDITLSNPITLHQRNNPAANILNTGGNNILSGNIDINVGGSRGNIESNAGLLTLSGTITTSAGTSRNLHLGGDGNGLVTGPITNNPNNAAVLVAVHKNGTGTWTLAGSNTYTGETSVNAGTLAIANPVLADTAAVRIAADGTLHLSHASTDTVDRLFIDGVEQFIGTWGPIGSSATYKSARITGTGILNVTNGITPPSGYGTWASATGLTSGVNDASTFDADSDGFNNGTEYILGGLPLNGSNNPKIHSLLADSNADVDADPELILTIAVPVGTPAFSAGSPTSSATFEGYVVTVRGSTDLNTFPVTVTPVDPITTGLPAAPVQGGITYEYRSFSLNGSNGTPDRGFLQVLVTQP